MSNWVLQSNDSVFMKDVKEHEGTIAYQTKKGYFKNGRFVVYNDSRGLPTIGYGHLVLKGESFAAGLTEAEADALLVKDATIAFNDARSIYEQFGMKGPVELQRVLWQMCFQMGKSRVLGFQKALKAMGAGDYKEAGRQMRDSAWYKQTTSRAELMARIVEGL